MNVNDIDLDVANLLNKVPKDHVSFFFRASDGEENDFAYFRGDPTKMAEALANIMSQNDQISNVIQAAFGIYFQDSSEI